MRIAFVGTVEFSQHCLTEIFNDKGNVVAVLTLPSSQAQFHSDYADLEPLASAYGVPTHHIRKINSPATITLIKSLLPDVIFIFGFSQLITKEIIEIPPMGCIGSHPALLPKNRGRHPLIWALVEGLSESGLTFFYIDEGTDSGDILWQKPFPITIADNASTLYNKMKVLASEAIREFLPALMAGNPPRVLQDHSKATYWRKRSEADGEIIWSGPSLTIYNLIRALTHPYVGAHTHWGGQKMVVWRSKLVAEAVAHHLLAGSFPGETIQQTENGVWVRTGDGVLELLDWEPHNVPLTLGAILGRLSS